MNQGGLNKNLYRTSLYEHNGNRISVQLKIELINEVTDETLMTKNCCKTTNIRCYSGFIYLEFDSRVIKGPNSLEHMEFSCCNHLVQNFKTKTVYVIIFV